MRSLFPHGSHITRKRGVYCYRRRLPAPLAGEVLVSLSTRRYREAEHRAELLDAGFEEALRRAVSEAEKNGAELAPILRQYLKQILQRDLEDRVERPPGHPVYAYWWEPGDPGTVTDADLRAIREERNGLKADVAANRLGEFEELAEALLARHGLPPTFSRALAVGLMEARIRGLDIAERRTLGLEPLVFPEEEQPAAASVQSTAPEEPTLSSKPAAPSPQVPLASALVEPHFERRTSVDRATHQVMGQERGTLRRFLEVCGDRPVNAYRVTPHRADTARTGDDPRRQVLAAAAGPVPWWTLGGVRRPLPARRGL